MPSFYPSSYGAPLRRRTIEHNPCHEPGGKPTGGQFAAKGASGCTSTGDATPHQKKLFGQDAMAKFGDRQMGRVPVGGEPSSYLADKGEFKPDTPTLKSDEFPAPKEKLLLDFTDETDGPGSVDDALSALGISMSAEDIAKAMVNQIAGESFEVTAKAEGQSGVETYDGPDPDDVRGEYDEWHSEQYSEAESELHQHDRREFVSNAESNYADVLNVMHDAMGDRMVTIDEPYSEWTPEQKAAAQNTQDLMESVYEAAYDTDGTLNRNYEEKIAAVVEKFVRDYPDSKLAKNTGDFDEDEVLKASAYFNDNDGWDNWLNDSMTDGRIEVKSFDEWYEWNYGHSPDNYSNDTPGEWGDESTVTFAFKGSEGTSITRTFSLKDGDLHVHHDYFTANSTGDGVAKQLYQGSLPVYDKIGVQHISTLANIDIGAYAWARFGFESDSPRRLARELRADAETKFHATGLLTGADWDRLASLMPADGYPEGRFVWDIADAKYYTTPEKAMSLVQHWVKKEPGTVGREITWGSTGTFNKKARAEAAKGVVSIGRLLLVGKSWDATLDLHDEANVSRLESYVGVWRQSRRKKSQISKSGGVYLTNRRPVRIIIGLEGTPWRRHRSV